MPRRIAQVLPGCCTSRTILLSSMSHRADEGTLTLAQLPRYDRRIVDWKGAVSLLLKVRAVVEDPPVASVRVSGGKAGTNVQAQAYRDAYRRALEDPEGFWGERAAALVWERRWDKVLDATRAPLYRWFTGGRINT